MQTWTINGKTFNIGQLRELKKQGIDPRKDDFEMKAVTKPKKQKAKTAKKEDPAEKKKNSVEPKEVNEANEGIEQSLEDLQAAYEAKHGSIPNRYKNNADWLKERI